SYSSYTPTEAQPPASNIVEQVLSTRGDTGWSSQDVSPPHGAPVGSGVQQPEYQLFSEDLSSGLVNLGGQDGTLLSVQASETTPYLRALTCEPAVGECYAPLVTGKEGEYQDVQPGTAFGGSVDIVGASPDLRHVVLRTSAQLTEVATGGYPGLYEWSADRTGTGRLALLSVLPEGEGGGPVTTGLDLGNNTQENYSSGTKAISADGSHVFWSAQPSVTAQIGVERLYARDTTKGANGETVRLDLVQPGAVGGTPFALFQFASPDGSKVFFTDSERLTEHSSKRGADLYECQLVEEAAKLKCDLTDLTPEGAGGPTEVQNILPGASEDGSYTYFVANAVLTGSGAPVGTPRGSCAYEQALVTCNLYVLHNGGVRFIATLSSEDELDWGGASPILHSIGNLTTRVSPDGRYLAFMSTRPLTGYDNRDARSGNPDAEVFLYNAVSNRLACVSCDPTGARPVGVEVEQFKLHNGADLAAVAEEVGFAYKRSYSWVAANLPSQGVAIGSHRESLHSLRGLSDTGRLFFNSSDSLVPTDVNGQEDVYEYEPLGSDCEVSSSGYSEAAGGCVGLISSGISSGESGLLDASLSGDDVFFLTREKLVAEDGDTALDVYDARVCTASEPCSSPPASPPACATADACRAAPTPQPAVFGTPASATFSGAGDVRPPAPASKPAARKSPRKCAKGKRASHGRCVKRSKGKAKKANRAGNRRGAVR
ncbi:MAG TPA: hypothetical protein VNU24_05780, partial [Solirubrobacteraceae bacterium]|nr:hypothetical protein [Solirubrobacteraceae bacterium]